MGRRTGVARTGIGVIAVTAGAYAWWVTDLRPFTLPALVAVLGGGSVAVALGATVLPPRPPPMPVRPRHAGVWAALAAALGLLELTSFLQRPRSEHPTVSSLTNTLFESHPARALGLLVWLAAGVWVALTRVRAVRSVLLVSWLWLGWHVFVRGSY